MCSCQGTCTMLQRGVIIFLLIDLDRVNSGVCVQEYSIVDIIFLAKNCE